MRRYFLFYMSCFGEREVADMGTSRKNTLMIAAYLRDHAVAYPLYIVSVRAR